MPTKKKETLGKKLEKLVDIMITLRDENGCPWDKEQTHESLTQYLLEETYEVLEAISEVDPHSLEEELGDLLLQIVFHAQIAAENKCFDIAGVIDSICAKLIRRHPNVFGTLKINSAKEQSINWERLKKKEGKSSVLDGVPRALPGLLRAHRIQQKASTVGFDWPVIEPVWDKVSEEVEELRKASQQENKKRLEEEFGDLLFSLVNVSRFLGVNPEEALRKTTEKFIGRFQQVERKFANADKSMSQASLEELDAIWDIIKNQERRPDKSKVRKKG